MIKQALKSGSLKGILWHQGESDVQKRDHYMVDLMELINAFRRDLDIPNLPFVMGEISESKEARIEFNRIIRHVSEIVPYTGVVKVDGLSTFDGIHFDSKSQRRIGKRYAAEIKKFLY